MLVIRFRGVAQPGSASVLGTEGRRFKSSRPDQQSSLYKAQIAVMFRPRACAHTAFCGEAYRKKKNALPHCTI